MTTCNYVHLVYSKFISIKGEDRKEFLQDMITNDINKCIEDNPIYSCFLSPQGKFLYKGAAEGPKTMVNLELGCFSKKYLRIPVVKILSPIKFEEITNIFTDRFYC